MRATLRMPVDTLFGNRVEIEVSAELSNVPEVQDVPRDARRHLLADMVSLVELALLELNAADERVREAAASR